MKVRVQNFQSLADVTVEVKGLTVIVGPSNFGKSALLRAIVGALFNRPGTHIVREGEKSARVEIAGAPTIDGRPLDVVWEKGRGVNEYTVNGESFTNVKQKAPQPLLDAGYRDLTLDEKSSLRPQVGGQFDPIFLLQQPGSTISEVLTRASRLDILLRASAACAKDLRSARQVLGLRRSDHQTAQQALDTIEGPIIELQTRVAALAGRAEALRTGRERLDALARLAERRSRLRQGADASLPPHVYAQPAVALAAHMEALQGLSSAHARVRSLAPVEPSRVPDGAVAESGQKAQRLAALWVSAAERRRLAVSFPALPAPSAGVEGLEPIAARLAALLPSARVYPRLAPVRTLALPAPSPRLDFERPADYLAKLSPLATRLVLALSDLRHAEAAFAEGVAAVEEAESHTQNLLQELGVCPACGRAHDPVAELLS